jgi:hypothetical protein
VTRYALVPRRYIFVFGKDFESNANILHFLGDRGSPKGIAVELVQGKGLLDGFRQVNAKFMGPLKVAGLSPFHKGNNPISLGQDMWYPPIKGSFMADANQCSIFGCFNWMGLF